MNWSEIIHLTAAEEEVKRLLEVMPERCTALHQVHGLQEASLLMVDQSHTDMIVILQWYLPETAPKKSREGCCLAQYFEQFGMVHHKILRQVFPPHGVVLRGGY